MFLFLTLLVLRPKTCFWLQMLPFSELLLPWLSCWVSEHWTTPVPSTALTHSLSVSWIRCFWTLTTSALHHSQQEGRTMYMGGQTGLQWGKPLWLTGHHFRLIGSYYRTDVSQGLLRKSRVSAVWSPPTLYVACKCFCYYFAVCCHEKWILKQMKLLQLQGNI